MNLSLLPAQLKFVKTENPYPAIVGGLGSGKTRAGTIRLILLMLKEPGINTLYTMPTYDLLRLRAMPGVEEDLNALGIEYKLNKQEFSIKLAGFGAIYFRSYDRPERIVSFEVAHSLLDELDTLPKEKAEVVWRKVSERTRQKCNHGNSIGNVTTPDMGVHGFTYEKWVKKKQPGYELIKASTLDNFYLPESYVEQIRSNYDELLADLYLNGEFVTLTDKKVYHFFNRERHHTDRQITEFDKTLYIGCDFNVGGSVAIVFVIDGNTPIAVDEFVSHDSQDMRNNIIGRYLRDNKHRRIVLYPDASGSKNTTNASASDIAILVGESTSGWKITHDAPRKNPYVRDRINSVNGLLSHDEIKVNCNKCSELAFALESQGYDKTNAPEKFNTHPAIDDYNDSFGYFIHRRYPIRKPVVDVPVQYAV